MYSYRMTRRERDELIVELNEAARVRREDTRIRTGLSPARRPLDSSGQKIKGKQYRQWQEDIARQG